MRLLAAIAVLIACVPALAQDSPALLLFGGDGHKTFLGCLNCGRFDSGSVCNKFGNYGSKFSNYSPWNRFASEPPAIVDASGNFYGYLTANRYNPKRTTIKALVALTDLWKEVTDDPESVADVFCGRD